jgi:hypothetical protein
LAVGSTPGANDCVDGAISSSSARRSSALLSRPRVTVALSGPGSVVNFRLAKVGHFCLAPKAAHQCSRSISRRRCSCRALEL